MRPGISLLLLICLLSITVISFSDTPPANTIPVIGLKANYEDIDTEFFCMLSRHNFDGLSRQFYEADSILAGVVLSGDTTGMLTVINPWNLTSVTNWYSHMFEMSSDSAYSRPGWKDLVYYIGYTPYTCNGDTILANNSTVEMITEMTNVAEDLDTLFNQNSHSVWFYYGYDEAPAIQWKRMVTDSIKHVYSGYDDYMPNMFTQAMDSVYRPDIDSTMKWQPTLEAIDPRGVISWMNHYIKQEDSSREFCYVISTMHTIKDWAGMNNIELANNSTPPNFSNQAQAVRSLFSMQYQGYNPSGAQPIPENNFPHFIALDAYPFRLVGTLYQDTASYTPQLGTSLENWMLDHYEEGMDSTFITAWNIRNNQNKDISVLFVPQSFGRAGGTGMWTNPPPPANPVLNYGSYAYRIPTPQEFRMTCNSALIRQAKAIFPYCLTTYEAGPEEQRTTDAGLLDENNIPYDAPYEEWVYRNRPTDDITFIPPDSIAPFIDGYDPLYDLPSRPDTIENSDRNTENYLLWKFKAYGRLWNSAGRTFGEIARVAPELALLEWWESNENNADIIYDGTVPSMFRYPEIKVFTDENEGNCYLYYLNTFCRANNNPFEIVVEASDFPSGTPFSKYALDHSRRFIIEGELTGQDTYTYKDTLDAGEARLIQMFNGSLDADIRITDPDLSVILPVDGDTLLDYTSTSGTPVDILARFYNMGTASTNYIQVYLYDVTDEVFLDTTRISFNGLSTSSCYTADMDIATLKWTPRASDAGVHVLKIYTEQIPGEPDQTDNSATLVYVVKPKDYASEVLNNPWDMTEATGTGIPLWYTNDITGMTGWNISAYSDSVSGMFEGGISNPTQLNRIFLNTGTGSSDWIDAGNYINLSIAGKATHSLDVVLHWVDCDGNTSYIDTGIDLTPTWREFSPVDLSGISGSTWGDSIKTLWIELGGSNLSTDVRIGWLKLTE